MRQEVRFLLAITLMILVLVSTNILFPPVPPEDVSGPGDDPAGQLDSSEVTGTPTFPLGGADAGGVAAGGAAAGVEPSPVADQPAAAPSAIFGPEEVPAPAPEDTVVVEGPLYRFVWSTSGARLMSAQLLEFQSFDEGKEELPVELIVEGSGGALAMQLRVDAGVLDLVFVP